MKLSELRMCDSCRGPVGQIFYVVRTTLALVKPQAFNQVAGLSQMFGGHLGLAEIFAPEPDAVKLLAETEIDGKKPAWTELLICQDCYMGMPREGVKRLPSLAEMAERRAEAEDSAAAKAAGAGGGE